MKKNYLFVLSLLWIVGCGDDPSTEYIPVHATAMVSETQKNLPKCDAQNEGRVAYVVDSGELFYCQDGGWNSSIQGAETRDSFFVFESTNIAKTVTDTVYIGGNAGFIENVCAAEPDTTNYHVTKVTCGKSEFYVENRLAHKLSTKYGDDLVDPRDKKKYKTVVIGKQTWMAENLQYEVEGSTCLSDSAGYCEKYGRVYNQDAALVACPNGWHLPSRDEIDTLIKFVDTHNGGYSSTQDLVARDVWRSGDMAYDVFGFSILPAGYRSEFGTAYTGQFAGFWTTPNMDIRANMCWLKEHGEVYSGNSNSTLLEKYITCDVRMQLSVRCLKNGN